MKPTEKTVQKITIDELDARFTFKVSRIVHDLSLPNTGGIDYDFKTHGEDLAFVKRQDPATVWTLIDCHAGWTSLQSGYHEEASIRYYISNEPVPENLSLYVWMDPDD